MLLELKSAIRASRGKLSPEAKWIDYDPAFSIAWAV
jgi:hypothetical protein